MDFEKQRQKRKKKEYNKNYYTKQKTKGTSNQPFIDKFIILKKDILITF